MAAPRQAPQACVPCRTLKRKCTKELPTCSLCRQLSKRCEYPNPSRVRPPRPEDVNVLSQRLNALEQRFGNQSSQDSNQSMEDVLLPDISFVAPRPSLSPPTAQHGSPGFPATYFLDNEVYQPMNAEKFNPRGGVPVQVLDTLQDLVSLIATYMATMQIWLPMISRKRLLEKVNSFNQNTDGILALLLLCMKLAHETPDERQQVTLSPLYLMSKDYYFRVENGGGISLQLLQSAILIAVYEIGHGIYPAGYLTITNAARLGIILGYHDRKKAPQLFIEPDTWTQREEERRTWWAVLILERYVNLGVSGLPPATPEPDQGTLIPTTELSWNQGGLGSNVPLFASSFAANTEIGSYASTCQACHILGLVLRHRDDHSTLDTYFRITEAQRLHQMLVLLNTHLEQRDSEFMDDSNTAVAAALCYAARFILYNMYACNEHNTGVRLPEETEMQIIAIDGLKEITHRVFELAKHISVKMEGVACAYLSYFLLITHCLYLASSEIAWFVREEKNEGAISCLKVVVGLLRKIGTRWRVVGKYLQNLEADGSLAAIAE